ncbi:a-factor receptor, partial [Ascosphaera acerosa]
FRQSHQPDSIARPPRWRIMEEYFYLLHHNATLTPSDDIAALRSNGIDASTYRWMAEHDPYFGNLAPAGWAVITLGVVGLPMTVPPAILLYRASNLPGCQLALMFMYCALCNIINPAVWRIDNMATWWTGFLVCDVQIRVQAYINTAIMSNVMCVLWSLASALRADRVGPPTRWQKKKKFIFECLFCCGIPLLISLVSIIVQSTRYTVRTIMGCALGVSETVPTVILYQMWSLIFIPPSIYFAATTLWRLWKYHHDLQELISSSDHRDKQRIYRLLALALTLLLVCVPVQCYNTGLNIHRALPFRPFSLREVHNQSWSTPTYEPAMGQVLPQQWLQVACPFVLFAFFGVGKEARKLYLQLASSLRLDGPVKRIRARRAVQKGKKRGARHSVSGIAMEEGKSHTVAVTYGSIIEVTVTSALPVTSAFVIVNVVSVIVIFQDKISDPA